MTDNSTLMFVLMIVMLVQQFWLRRYYFARKPRLSWPRLTSWVYSPVEGELVYTRYESAHADVYCDKGDRRIHTPLDLDTMYIHWGVFMTPFDNHHVVLPVGGKIVSKVDVMDTVNMSMATFWDRLKGFDDWWARKIDGFLSHNQRTVYTWTVRGCAHPVYMVVIMDRFVNKLFQLKRWYDIVPSGDVIAFIGRGSQVDLFVATSDLYSAFSLEGHVTYNTRLASL